MDSNTFHYTQGQLDNSDTKLFLITPIAHVGPVCILFIYQSVLELLFKFHNFQNRFYIFCHLLHLHKMATKLTFKMIPIHICFMQALMDLRHFISQ